MEHTSLKTRIKSHYHWVVAAVVLIEFAVACGFTNNLYSLYLIPITEDLGVSRSAFSVSPSIRYFSSFFSNLIFAMFYNRHGYRKLATMTFAVTGVMYLIYSRAQNLIPFYVGAAIVGILEAFYSTASASRMITDWFHKHQGLILGVVMASSGLSSSVFTVMMTNVMEKGSFRNAMTLSALFLFATAVLIVVFARNKPADMGLEPMGEEHHKQAERKKYARKNLKEWDGIPRKELRKKAFFYTQILGTFLFTLTIYAVYPSIISHAQDVGLSADDAALLHSSMFLILAGAKVVEGALVDKFGAKPVMYLCLILNAASIVIMIFAKTFVMIFLALIIFSLPLAAPTIMVPTLTAEQFGRHDYGSLLGIFLASGSISGVMAFPSLNMIYDRVGSYVPGYLVMTVLACAAIVLFAISFRGAARERARFEAAKAE